MTGPGLIWAWASAYKPQGVSLSGGKPPAAMEYIRRDPAVIAALPEVQAMIAGAFEAAAQLCERWREDALTFGMKSDATCFETARDEIRALTPSDAIAARDAMIAADETRALDSVTTLHTVIANIRAATVGDRPMLSDLAQALVAWRDEAVAKEREACWQAAHDAVTHPSAYACREAIRKRGEGQP